VRRIEVADLRSFREAARALVRSLPPEEVRFTDAGDRQLDLLGEAQPAPATAEGPRVPRAFLELADAVSCHPDPARWDRLYRTLWRLSHGEPALLEISTDADVRALRLLEKAVHRDVHHVHAFVRFRRVVHRDEERYVAWHKPQTRCLRLAAPFFVSRFPNMKWSILTPDESAHFDGELRLGPGVPRESAPREDDLDSLWLAYYSAIFNPARANPRVLVQHLPVHHWDTLPEARTIVPLLQKSGARVRGMSLRESAASAFLPAEKTLPALAQAARGCSACELCGPATQTVFGEGPADARAVLVGEQPGDREDIEGRPFVGPAGEVLDDALARAGLAREKIYVTNAVKHFKFEPRGKIRLHQRPSAREVTACRAWVQEELAVVKPKAVLCLGATAAQSLLGPRFSLTRNLGRVQPAPFAPWVLATYHPSAVLRAADDRARDEIYGQLVRDLAACAKAIEG
jgi:DNA polymerase